MTEEIATSSGRFVELSEEDPPQQRPSPGRRRKPTEFDDIVLDAYERGKTLKVEFEDEEDLSNLRKQVDKALEYHDLGADRTAQEGVLWVRVRDKKQYAPRESGENGWDEDEDEDEDA